MGVYLSRFSSERASHPNFDKVCTCCGALIAAAFGPVHDQVCPGRPAPDSEVA